MTTQVTRIKKARTSTASSIQKAETLLTSIGEKQIEINRINREVEEKIKAIEAEAAARIAKLTKDRNRSFNSLYMYTFPQKNRLTVTHRSVRTNAGTFGWRFTPPFVKIAEGANEQDVIKYLEEYGLHQYVRTVKTVDRAKLLEDKAILPSVISKGEESKVTTLLRRAPYISFPQYDEFFAKPKLPKEAGHGGKLSKTEVIDV